jgi:three-Cys-motif partner protein
MIALGMEFSEFHFIDKNRARVKALRELASTRPNVHVYHGDCNTILVNEVFPQYTYDSYKRALCLLDPYKLNPNWEVVSAAGAMKTIEIFLNFSIMDANMNVFKHNQDKVEESQIRRMNVFWGDDSWKKVAYNKGPTLFGDWDEKTSNEAIASAYKVRLRDVAGFKFLPDPIPMKNSTGAVIYYIFFASHNETGYKIAKSIFKKHKGN